MSCPASIYTVLTNYVIAEDAQDPFGAIIRRFGRNVQLDGQGINLLGSGYYDLDASLSFTPTATVPSPSSTSKTESPFPALSPPRRAPQPNRLTFTSPRNSATAAATATPRSPTPLTRRAPSSTSPTGSTRSSGWPPSTSSERSATA